MQVPKAAAWIGLASIGALLLLYLVMGSCSPIEAPIEPYEPLLAQRPECPQKWDSLPNAQRRVPIDVPETGLTLPGPITNVPEFHDCQRFILPGDTLFGHLVAVFVRYKLDVFMDSIMAMVNVAPNDSTTINSLATAQIYNYGPAYGPLGIAPNFSCLYLSVAGGTWRAKMVPVGEKDQDCAMPRNLNALNGTPLTVVRTQAEGLPREAYPLVARWDRDSLGTYYVGMSCGDAWCDIGPDGFKPARAHYQDDSDASRVLRIKGWYDEQHLATRGANEDDPRPSGIRGTVIPHPDLHTYEGETFTTWTRAGYIALDSIGPGFTESIASYYKTKFNLSSVSVTKQLDQMNQIHICHGTRARCSVPNSGMSTSELCGPDKTWYGRRINRWWVKLQSPAVNNDVHKCVTRRGHEDLDVPIPGTARWRWLIRDETVWERCTHGCCEVDG